MEIDMGDAMPALWVPVAGYEGFYLISHRGFARGVPRQGCDGRILKPQVAGRGYLQVTLSRSGVQTPFYIHRLVMEAFVGECPEGQEVRHLDGNPANNTWPENLIYGTHIQNMADMVGHGRSIAGTRHPFTKLTDADIIVIREAWQAGESGRLLAARYETSPAAISRLVNGICYRTGEILARPRETCHFPGCGELAEEGADGRGKPLVFCPDPAHNNQKAKGARKVAIKAARVANCVGCGDEFSVRRTDMIYCSRTCKAQTYNAETSRKTRENARTGTCEDCGTSFTARRCDQRFCSARCQEKARSKRRIRSV